MRCEHPADVGNLDLELRPACPSCVENLPADWILPDDAMEALARLLRCERRRRLNAVTRQMEGDSAA